MADDDSQGLLKSVLGFFARKRPERSAQPGSLRSRTREAWFRTDAYLQHDADEIDEIDPERLAKMLRTIEDYVQFDSDPESDSVSTLGIRQAPICHPSSPYLLMNIAEQSLHHDVPYPKLQAMRSMIEHPSHGPHSSLEPTIRLSKRKREGDAVIQELSHLDREIKKRRKLPREEPNFGIILDETDTDFAVLMRRHLASLDNALRRHWICVCQKCSGLSVRLLLPQPKEDHKFETCFEVFFGVRSLLTTVLQEARITVR